MLKSLNHRGAGRFLKKLGCLMRFLLLFITLAGVGIALVWIYVPKKVMEIDNRTKARHLGSFQKRLDAARNLLSEGKPEGRMALEALLADLSHVRKGDQLKRVKEQCFQALEPTYLLPDDSQKLVQFYTEWRAFDNRDLRPEVGLASTLLSIPERKEEGKAALTQLYERIPEAPLVADAYAAILLEQGSPADFFEHFLRQIRELRKKALTNNWFFYWNTGKGFVRDGRGQATVTWSGPHEVEISCKLPPASYWAIRLDSPPWLPICLAEPEFTLTGGKQPAVARLADTTQRLNDTVVQYGMYFADEGDPYMTSLLPEVAELGKDGLVTFRAGLLPGSFKKLIQLLPTAKARELLKPQLNEEDQLLFTQLEAYFPPDQ